ncbi:MAG TPA: hypothetical protein VGP26_03200 [Actinophytocola sp.]|jgi:hypothetical protein|nr:hypothetical protein [Actinophytocola sp.]
MNDPNAELTELARSFGADLRRGIGELSRPGYDATPFRRMIGGHGPVEVVRRPVLAPAPSYGLWRLQKLGRLVRRRSGQR